MRNHHTLGDDLDAALRYAATSARVPACRTGLSVGGFAMKIRLERHDAAALVVLDSPETRNALGPDESRELRAVVARAADDRGVCGVVITGEGAFCAGGNIKGMAQRASMPVEQRRTVVYSAYQGLIQSLLEVPVPTTAS
jgi:enoyl-CoA hydratase/carnithine racemase